MLNMFILCPLHLFILHFENPYILFVFLCTCDRLQILKIKVDKSKGARSSQQENLSSAAPLSGAWAASHKPAELFFVLTSLAEQKLGAWGAGVWEIMTGKVSSLYSSA